MEQFDWKNLPFGYIKTDYNIRCKFKDGKWGNPEVSSSEYIDIHIAATGLHYGQEAFEGMKAYMGKDGKISVFRWDENAKRFIRSAEGVKMAPVPVELFKECSISGGKTEQKICTSVWFRSLLVYKTSALRQRSGSRR